MDQDLQFGRYRLVHRLGNGGMAEIWKALDESGRTVVVKRVLPELAESDDVIDMFRREARLALRFRHPGVVAAHEAGQVGDEPFLAMEYLPGRNLIQVMSTLTVLGRPPVGFGVYVARELCRALAYVHSLTNAEGQPLGLVHRDVSPANVMVGPDGSVKLLDFGIAKPLNDPEREATQVGILKGKVAYLSPEGVEDKKLDHRADQFAVGIVLHELLTGRRLFRGANDLDTMKRVAAAKVVAPSQLNPAVTPELDRIVLRALSRDRQKRFASCRDLAVELDLIVERMGWTHLEVGRLMTQLFAGEPEPVARRREKTLRLPAPTVTHVRRRSSRKWTRHAAVAVLAMFASLGGLAGWHMAQGRMRLLGQAAGAVAASRQKPGQTSVKPPLLRGLF